MDPVTLTMIGLALFSLIVSVVAPIVGYRRWQRKGVIVGCLLQPVIAAIIFAASLFLAFEIFSEADGGTTSIRSLYNGEVVVTFDLDAHTVSAVHFGRPLEVVSIDWGKVEQYFKETN